jgi:DNA-binding response OmpR family regulator
LDEFFQDFFSEIDYAIVNFMRVLLIEDDLLIGRSILRGLEASPYEIVWCKDGTEGFAEATKSEGEYALIILDLMLPGMDGWSICRRLRERRDTTPILMLSALDEVEDRVRGLDLGADDYLPKPFALTELRARISALLRRERTNRGRRIRVADLEIDTETQEVWRRGKVLALSPREYVLLETLVGQEGRVVSKERILARWGDSESISNTVEAYIASLRRKIDQDRPELERLIQTLHRRGYMFQVPPIAIEKGEEI